MARDEGIVGALDESPYRRLGDVLARHAGSVRMTHPGSEPILVLMAGVS